MPVSCSLPFLFLFLTVTPPSAEPSWIGKTIIAKQDFAASVLTSTNDGESIDIINKAIKAHGGKEHLKQMLQCHVLFNSVVYNPHGEGLKLKSKYWFKAQCRQRFEAEFEIEGKQHGMTLIVRDNQGWAKIDNGVAVIPKVNLHACQEKCHTEYIKTLYPLIEDPGYKLKLLEDKQLEGLPAVGIRISSVEHWDVDLYFSKQSYLLIGINSKEVNGKGDEYHTFTYLSDHKDYYSLKYPTKIFRPNDNRGKLVENVEEFIPLTSIDESRFEKPR